MRKRLYAVLFSLFLTLFSCGLIGFSYASVKDGPPVSMEVSSVFGEIGKLGVHVPVTVRLFGQSEVSFDGAVIVRTLENGAEAGEEIYEYQYPVQVDTGQTTELQLYVPLGQKSSRIHILLMDQWGEEVASESLKFEISRDMGRLLVGVLSEEPEALEYLDGIGMEYGMVNSVMLPMDRKDIPEDEWGLELMDVLVVNRFDTRALTGEQIKAILNWVSDGGTLLLGTGVRAEDTLTAFRKELEIEVTENITFEQVSLGMEYAENAPGEAEVGLLCAEINIKDGLVVTESDGIPLFTKTNYGSGYVGVYCYDLNELTDFVERNPSYGVKLFTDALGEDGISDVYYYSSHGSEQEYWNAHSLVNTGSSEKLPNLLIYAIVISVYVILIGPGFYLFLRKRDMSGYYGTFVVMTAGMTAMIIYLLGSGTRFTSQFLTVASIMEMKGSRVAETSYVNVRTPDSRPFSITIPKEYQVTPLTRSDRYDEQLVSDFSEVKEENVEISFGENGTELSAKKTKAFEPRYFRVKKETESNLNGQILGSLEYSDGKISGWITNGMPFPVEDAAVILYGHMYRLGDMEPGEVRELQREKLEVWPVGMAYVAASGIIDETDSSDNMVKSNLYTYYINELFYNYQSGAYFIAMGPEGGILSDPMLSEQEGSGLFFYSAGMEVSSGQEGLVYRSGLKQKPNVNSGTGSIYGDGLTMYNTEPISVEYFLGTDIQVEKVSFCQISQSFLEDSEYYYLKSFDGSMYFYNYTTKAYDRVNLSKTDYTADELRPYLSQKNSMVVKYKAGETEHGGISLLLPHLMVTGREN